MSTTETPEDLRRRILLIEGDHKAYFESTQNQLKANTDKINDLRSQTKTMALKLKTLTSRAGGSASNARLQQLDTKISDGIKRHNLLRAQALQKEKELSLLSVKLDAVEAVTADGENPDDQRFRDLDNQADRATIRTQEAGYIANIYTAMLKKLDTERLSFEGHAATLEAALAEQGRKLAEMEVMSADAQTLRDAARAEFTAFEAHWQKVRKEQDDERTRLYHVTEERRRLHEAQERRQRLKSGQSQVAENEDEDISEDAQWKITTYEAALRRIQTVTGVVEIEDVVARFGSQGATQANLTKLQTQSTEKLNTLRQLHARVSKQHEALKYTGQARNNSSLRMLKDFETHLAAAEARRNSHRDMVARLNKKLVAVRTGADQLANKVAVLDPAPSESSSSSSSLLSGDAAAAASADDASAGGLLSPTAPTAPVALPAPPTVVGTLRTAGARLAHLAAIIDAHAETLAATTVTAPVVLPEHNTRVGSLEHTLFADDDEHHRRALAAKQHSDSEEEDEVVPRSLLKAQSESAAALAAEKAKKK